MRSTALVALWLLGCANVVVRGDAGRAEGGPLDVTGTWRHCHTTLVFDAHGGAQARDHRMGCDREGTYTIDGSTLVMEWTGGTCGPQTMPRTAVRSADSLTMIDETGHVTQYADEDTPYDNWRFDAVGDARSTIVRRVGTLPASPVGSGCYWSADRACGGLFSCSGTIAEWRVEDGMLQASTLCGGGCVCTSIIEGTIEGDTIDATFSGINCERSFEGAFVGARIEDP